MKIVNTMNIPVIDLFAGPGGLGEGFCRYSSDNMNIFDITLSIEKDIHAHDTLQLRSFYRRFAPQNVPYEYYQALRGEITIDRLYNLYPEQFESARNHAWRTELGKIEEDEVDRRLRNAIKNNDRWVLIGGPPCQAYSTAGRSRNKGIKNYIPEEDKKHFLYREYLRIIANHWPSVFIMENVRGILSSKVKEDLIFPRILGDLRDPSSIFNGAWTKEKYKYKIFSLTKFPDFFGHDGTPGYNNINDYTIQCEDYGIPQARHRLILLGIREDTGNIWPDMLVPQEQIAASQVLDDLPKLRSELSREEDTHENWEERVSEIIDDPLFDAIYDRHENGVWDRIGSALAKLHVSKENGRGQEFLPYSSVCRYREDWYCDPRLGGVCNHLSKAHMTADLHRYMFAACFAAEHGRSPVLPEFPKALWPEHKNAARTGRSGNFSDRFRVQPAPKPATTIMSHISKDGHYYIRYDASQCRSLAGAEIL